jgi:hypothetical protein
MTIVTMFVDEVYDVQTEGQDSRFIVSMVTHPMAYLPTLHTIDINEPSADFTPPPLGSIVFFQFCRTCKMDA